MSTDEEGTVPNEHVRPNKILSRWSQPTRRAAEARSSALPILTVE